MRICNKQLQYGAVMSMVKKFSFLAVLLASSSLQAEPAVIGQSKAAIVQCMGKPDRVINKSSNKTYLSYFSAKDHCLVTFKLRDNKIHHANITNLFGQHLTPKTCPIAKFDCISQQKVA